MASIEQLQESLDNRSLDPNTLSPKQRKIIDELISMNIHMPAKWELLTPQNQNELTNQLDDIINEMKKDQIKYGTKPEGVVVYLQGEDNIELPLIKYKDISYKENFN